MLPKLSVIEGLQSFLVAAGVIYGCLSIWVTCIDSDLRGRPFELHMLTSARAPVASSLGERIIGEAFNSSYYDLVDFCRLENNLDYRQCLQQASRMGERPGDPYGEKWPWWFRTLLRDTSNPAKLVHGMWHILQYTNPNIQQCISEKSGTKVWRKLHCDTIDKKAERAEALSVKGNISAFNCAKLQGNLRLDSERMVFIRNPLDRFLSGFLDKCTGMKLHLQPHCEPLMIFQNNETTPIAHMRADKKKLFEIYVDTFPLDWNLHFIPQSLYCDGLYRHIQNYDFVGSMDRNFHSDLLRLRETYPALGDRIDKVFKIELTEGENYGVETKAASQTLFYYSPHTVRRVLEYYAIDYVMLDIPVPAWAEEMLSKDPLLT